MSTPDLSWENNSLLHSNQIDGKNQYGFIANNCLYTCIVAVVFFITNVYCLNCACLINGFE